MERRLTAILAADVVGYSKLMGDDETRTLAALRQLRSELFEPVITEYNGHVVKRMGDGWLVEFPSVVDAINCAVSVQQGLHDHDLIKLRMGVHIGDVVFEEEDIYGDGVNVAARLQEISPVGGVIISDLAQRSIDRKLAAEFEDLGPRDLKNIAVKVRAYSWRKVPNLSQPTRKDENRRLTIAVLPFDNMSGEDEQDYFADGMSEDIITALSQVPEFRVIGRHSSFAYKGRSVDIKKVGQELEVRYVLEGSVRRAGQRVRINAQVSDTENGGQLWAKRFDGVLDDIFDLQDDITEQVVGAIAPEILRAEIAQARRKRPENMDAYDYLLQSYPRIWSMEPKATVLGKELLQKALIQSPDYALAHALLSFSNWAELTRIGGVTDVQALVSDGLHHARRAMELEPDNPTVQIILGLMTALSGVEFDGGVARLRAGLAGNPNSALGWGALGMALCYGVEAEEGITAVNRALRLDPKDPLAFAYVAGGAVGHFVLSQYQDCIVEARKAIDLNPKYVLPYRYLAASFSLTGMFEEARQVWQASLPYDPNYSASKLRTIVPLQRPEDLQRLVKGLNLAGMPE